jgi:Domain of unknown function (DUF1963)
MVLDLIDDRRWVRLVDAYRRREDLGPVGFTSVPKWNRAMDAWWAAFQEVVSDKALLFRARSLVDVTSDSSSLRFLHELLQPPVAEFELDVKRLLKDPRVDLDPAQVEWAFALYVSEHTMYGRDDPYESDDPDSELIRSASRVGGAPTAVPGRHVPDDPFLLQVDLGQQVRYYMSDPKAKSFLRSSGLPRGGVLQLFHTTTGDSTTEPDIPGGGATVVHLSESELRQGRTAQLSSECVAFPVRDAKLAVLPTFMWKGTPEDDTVEKVIALQDAVDQHARGEEVSAEVSLQQAVNPFRVTRQPPTRLLGLQHYDYAPLEPWDAEQLTARLPLQDPADEHVLLFNVASEFTLDSVFGEGGRLEVWIRRSDLVALRFDEVFSLIRMN